MLLFGEYKNLLIYKNDMIVFNLSSLIEGYERVNLLPPYNMQINMVDDKQFDIAYANFILNDENAFYDFMKIIMSLYNGLNVYILVGGNEGMYDFLTESLQKFIQSRYGIISYVINDISDWDSIVEDRSTFSLNGLYTMDIDKERFTYLFAKYNKIEVPEE